MYWALTITGIIAAVYMWTRRYGGDEEVVTSRIVWFEPIEDIMAAGIKAIAEGIAKAEGFLVLNSVAQRANNPGNLKAGDKGLGLIGGKTIYATLEDGWQALYQQLEYIITGKSKYYTADMTIREVAEIYTGHDNADAWARIVSGYLGVSPDTRFGDLA